MQISGFGPKGANGAHRNAVGYIMLELEVAFDFQCCSCGSHVGVTLRCAGDGLASEQKPLATVKVPCPTCQNVNRLVFCPDGTLYKVEPDGRRLKATEPSLN